MKLMPLSRKLKILITTFTIFLIFSIIGVIFVSQHPVINVAYDIFVQDDFAFVTNNDETKIIDVSEPYHPHKTGMISTSEAVFGLTV